MQGLSAEWVRGRRGLLGCALFGLGCVLGCRSHEPSSGARTEIQIGGTLPLTGAESKVGGFFKEGYELAFEEVERAGGLNVAGKKLKVKLELLDDTSTQATAVSLADKLINSNKVDFLLGTYSTPLVQAQSTVAEQNKVPYVSGGGAATEIYSRNYQYLFGLLAPVELLGDTLMQWIDRQQQAGKLPKPARIALVWENTAHGKDFRRGISEFARKAAGRYELVVDEPFELNGKDFGALLGKVKAASADLFLADAHLPDFITLQRQYVSAGLCHQLVSYGARGAEKGAMEALGQENVAYILSAVWWSSGLAEKNALAKQFVDAFQARYHHQPDWYQAFAYESARALFHAIETAGSLDREKVRAELERLELPSLNPSGTLTFPKEFGRQSHNPFVVQQNMPDGSSPIVYPDTVATGTGIAPNPRCAKR